LEPSFPNCHPELVSGSVFSGHKILRTIYDGHTLKPALESAEKITGVKIDSATVDRGYKGHGVAKLIHSEITLKSSSPVKKRNHKINQEAAQT